MEVLGILKGSEDIEKISFYFLLAGVFASLLSALTGNQAAELSRNIFSPKMIFPSELIKSHEDFAALTIWFYVFVVIWRTSLTIKKKFKGRIRYFFIIFAIVGAYLIWKTGKVGGELVYKHGVGTELTIPQDNRFE